MFYQIDFILPNTSYDILSGCKFKAKLTRTKRFLMNSQNQSKYRLQTHNLEFSLLIWFHIYGLFGE